MISMKKDAVGLFVGRFQPLHNGHLEAMKWALGKCSRLIILVGSSQKCYEPENPFTVGERIEMVHRALSAEKLAERCLILSIPDIGNNALWVAHVDSLVPRYDIVFSNNALTVKLFREKGKEVMGIPFFKRESHDGTKVRKAMLVGKKEWEKLVPKEVADFAREINALGRIKEVANGDKV
ncbi:MAG: nicotinamide-nucleotide adenylyltransferase [Candidatus Micrarchaeota archaeon]